MPSPSYLSRHSLSASLNIPFRDYEAFDSLKTWSEVFTRLDSYVTAMNSSLSTKDPLYITTAYSSLSSFIAYISVLAGIPPGTTPSAATNAEVANAYRHMITSLSKLGLANDINKDKTTPFTFQSRSASVVSGSSIGSISNSSRFTPERKFSIASEISEHGELDSFKLGMKETNVLAGKTRGFIKAFRQAENLLDEASLEKIVPAFYLNASLSSLPSASDSDEAVFPVKQFSAGMWNDVNVNRAGDYTDPLVSPTNSLKKSSLHLESFEPIIPLDNEVVTVLDYQRNMVITILRQIFNIFDKRSPAIKDHQLGLVSRERLLKDLRGVVISSLDSLISLVTNMYNLIESVDLSVFQMNRRKSSGTLFNNTSTSEVPMPPLFLLYELLEAKQALSDDLAAMISAVQIDVPDDVFIEGLARSLKLSNISGDQVPPSKTDEQGGMDDDEKVIKRRALELGVTVDSLVHTASALAEERAAILSFSNGDAYSALAEIETTSDSNSGPFDRGNHKLSRSQSGSSLAISTISGPAKDDVPWFLGSDYADEVVYDTKNHLRGGTLQALVERLTYHSSMNPTFNTAMLLTFRSFTTPQELFQELVRRFGIQPPEGLSQKEFLLWTDKKQKLVRLRVVNIMKKWLDEYWYEDCSNKTIQALLESMQAFAEQLQRQNNPGHERITRLIEAKLNADGIAPRRLIQNLPMSPPAPILPRNVKKLKILDIDPLELARQLTVREFKLFEMITPFECLTRRQRKTKLRHTSIESTRHIDAFIHNSNHLTNWVSYMILKYAETKKRALAIKYFVNVAEFCRQCNNFSSMMAVISALFSATIHRLKKTWAVVPPKTMETLDNMNKLMNSSRNFNEYRDILRMVSPPVIPFFGVYLSDLTFVEDGNPDCLRDNPIYINFAKRMKSAEIIREIMSYQIQHYIYQDVSTIQQLLDSGFAKAPPVDAQYDTSLALEPRERTNERMARLLEETGYM